MAEPSPMKFEIGHVLFIDIVGYSKLLINEQSEQLETLRKIVRATDQFRIAEGQGKLLRLPTEMAVPSFPDQPRGAGRVRSGNRTWVKESS